MTTTPTATPPTAPTPPAPPTGPVRPQRPTGAITLGIVLVILGALGLAATLGVEIPLRAFGPIVLILVGIGVAVSAVRGERSGGFLSLAVFIGVIVALASLVLTVLDVPLRGGVGERQHRPGSISEVEDSYHLLMGDLTVDLREVSFPAGTTELEVTTVLGQVEVLLPPGVAVDVDAAVGGGSARVFDTTIEGVDVDNDRRTEGYDTAERRLDLRVRVGLGESRVTR